MQDPTKNLPDVVKLGTSSFQKRKQMFEKLGADEAFNASNASLDLSAIDMSESSLPSPITPKAKYVPHSYSPPKSAKPRLQVVSEEENIQKEKMQAIRLHDSADNLDFDIEGEDNFDEDIDRRGNLQGNASFNFRNTMKDHPTFLKISSRTLNASQASLELNTLNLSHHSASAHSTSELSISAHETPRKKYHNYDSLGASSEHGTPGTSMHHLGESITSFQSPMRSPRRYTGKLKLNPFLQGTAFQPKVFKDDSDLSEKQQTSPRGAPVYAPYVSATQQIQESQREQLRIQRLKSKIAAFENKNGTQLRRVNESTSPTSPASTRTDDSDARRLPPAPFEDETKKKSLATATLTESDSASFAEEDDPEATQPVVIEDDDEASFAEEEKKSDEPAVETEEEQADDVVDDADVASVISDYLEQVEKVTQREAPKSKPTFQRSMGLDLETVPDVVPVRPRRKKNRRSKVDLKSEGDFSKKYFEDWMARLEKQINETLPLQELDKNYVKGLKKARKKGDELLEAIQKRQTIERKEKWSVEEMHEANKAVDKAKYEYELEMNDFEFCAERCLLIMDLVTGSDYQDENLTTYAILAQAGPKALTKWCSRGENNTQLLLRLLKDPPLQKQFLEAGGARDGNYGSCMEIYEKLYIPSNKNEVLRRVATAIALEFASPIYQFGKDTKSFIDPEKRFLHYKDAYLNGELDPLFSTLSVWELRHVVNSNASDSQLKWGRLSLLNYRPDLCLDENESTRYFGLTPIDIGYDDTERAEESWSMKKLIGAVNHKIPQAWYARFICKAFGVPTWGAIQNGDSGMTRRTLKGWKTHLGMNFDECRWQNRSGRDFLLESQARFALKTDNLYMEKVVRLECIALLRFESNEFIRTTCLPDPENPWYSLAMVQRHSMAMRGVFYPKFKKSKKKTLFESLTGSPSPKESIMLLSSEVKIPAGSYTKETGQGNKLILTKSFLGGNQLCMSQNSWAEFKLNRIYIPRRPTKYTLSMNICTIQRHEEPLAVAIITNNDTEDADIIKMKVPFTKGEWKDTKAAKLLIGGPRVASIRIRILLQGTGLAVKDITLSPRKNK